MTDVTLGLVGGALGTIAVVITTLPLTQHLVTRTAINRIIQDLVHYRENYWDVHVLDAGVPRMVVNECIDIIKWHRSGEGKYHVPHGRCRTRGSPRY